MPFRSSDEVSAAAWLVERLHPFGQDTGSVVPQGFDGYVRIFHPVDAGSGRSERWSDIAQRNGRLVHPEMQLHMITRPRGDRPAEGDVPGPGYHAGSLPFEQRRMLVDHLRRATGTPSDCWLCLWDGYGGVDDGGVSARVELPARSYLLARAGVDDVVESMIAEPWDQSPNLWWPADRAWVVITEIDYAWTYVGGSSALIEEILQDRRLEALRARLTDKPFYDSDRRNAALDSL